MIHIPNQIFRIDSPLLNRVIILLRAPVRLGESEIGKESISNSAQLGAHVSDTGKIIHDNTTNGLDCMSDSLNCIGAQDKRHDLVKSPVLMIQFNVIKA